MSVRQRVRQFVVDNFYVSDPQALSDDALLVTEGYVDSTGMMEIITFLETEFGIAIADQETTPENLESIARIAAFVARKGAVAAAG
jgi:acyl carrier protein